MIHKTRGIVLHTTRYGESSLVVHCYTEQFGRQSLMVKGVRKSRKNNRTNLFQPLFILDLELYHKNTREVQLVKEVSRAIPLNSIPYEITKSTQAIFIAEVLYRVVKEEEPNPMLTHFLINTIQYLDALGESSPDFHIIFLFQLSRYLGFYPQNNYGELNKFFDLSNGMFKTHMGDPEATLDESVSILWSLFMNLDYQSVKETWLNSTHRKIVLDNLVRYYKFHISGMGDIRSLVVLHDFFHN